MCRSVYCKQLVCDPATASWPCILTSLLLPTQAIPGRAPSPVPRRPGSAERWEHDGAAADAAAAAARIVPAKPSGDSRQRDQQAGAAPPSLATAQLPQTAVQKAAAAVPDRVAVAGTVSPSEPDNLASNAHPIQQANDSNGASVGGNGEQGSQYRKQAGRPNERLSHKESRSGVGDGVARGRRSASPVQQQKSSRGEAVAGPGSRWLLLLGLHCSVVVFVQHPGCSSCLGNQKQQQRWLTSGIRAHQSLWTVDCVATSLSSSAPV